MQNDLTEIAYVLDRSGSMQTLVSDAIGGFNSFLESQQKLWRWFVIAGLVIVLLETLIAANLSRQRGLQCWRATRDRRLRHRLRASTAWARSLSTPHARVRGGLRLRRHR